MEKFKAEKVARAVSKGSAYQPVMEVANVVTNSCGDWELFFHEARSEI